MSKRYYPVGIQSFETLRNNNYAYVDKTQLIYKLTRTDNSIFLNRPRRFGKSLLVSTLEAYFQGRKELFRGLAIEHLEKDWFQYPVLRLDMSGEKFENIANLHSMLNFILRRYENEYHITQEAGNTYGTRLAALIAAAHRQCGRKVVVLVDEYDAPMLDSLNNPERLAQIRSVMRSLYSPLKSMAEHLRFVFLTGISKFSQLSIFSELNNLHNISLQPEYEALCGITEQELLTQMKDDIELLAQANAETPEQAAQHLKQRYDGYHFSHAMTDIYNPFSLVNVFADKRYGNYWFATGTPTFLIEMLRDKQMALPDMENFEADEERFDAPTDQINDPVPVLYQSGYLTIKGYNASLRRYSLGFPNEEVHSGFAKSLTSFYTTDKAFINNEYLRNDYYDLLQGKIGMDQFLESFKDFLSSLPYDIANDNERHYQALLYTVLLSYGADVIAEDRTARGRIDVTLKLPQAIYIFELKYNKNSRTALQQVASHDYASKYRHDGRPVYAVGLTISGKHRTVKESTITQLV